MSVETTIEHEVLGLAMAYPKTLADMGQVRADHFTMPQTAAVWTLINQVASEGKPVDPISLATQLPRIPKLERTGLDAAWLLQCSGLAMTPVVAESRANQLVNAAEIRNLQSALVRAQQLAADATDAVEITELVRAEIDATIPDRRTGQLLADGLPSTLAALREESPVIPTPWPALNHAIGGWRPGALYVIGARPGIGKSIMGVNAALGLAHTGPVALNSLEMSASEIHQRLLSQTTEIALNRFKGVDHGQDPLDGQWATVERARDELSRLPLSVDDRAYITVMDIRAHARSVARKAPLAGIVVDYLQLMGTPRGDRRPRHEIVAEMSRDLKLLAKEMRCPVIALSQLNRASENRTSRKPTLADLRESGAIEQDADVVMLLHMDEDEDGRPDDNLMNVLVAKNRHGKTGAVQLLRHGHVATLNNYQKPLRSAHQYGNF